MTRSMTGDVRSSIVLTDTGMNQEGGSCVLDLTREVVENAETREEEPVESTFRNGIVRNHSFKNSHSNFKKTDFRTDKNSGYTDT